MADLRPLLTLIYILARPEFGVRFPVSAVWKKQKMFLPHPRVKVSIVGSLRDREVACSASDRQGSNFESCVWTVSSQSSHHPQEVLLAQFSLYVHFILYLCHQAIWFKSPPTWRCVSLPRHTPTSGLYLLIFISDRQGSNFESRVWRTVSSQSSHHPQEVLLAQFSLYVQFILYPCHQAIGFKSPPTWRCVSLQRPTPTSRWNLLIFIYY